MNAPDFSAETWAAIAVATTLLAGAGILGKLWTPLRRWIAVGDVVVGRPARYSGDPEERPGLVERLDRIDEHQIKADEKLNELAAHMTSLQGQVNNVQKDVQEMRCEE